ncbi:MAG TPA: hypothetical protein VF792_10175 [Ktedonobacterales bacterium]
MRFMLTVDVVVPPERGQEAAALVPAERAYVDDQLKLGALEAVYVQDATPATRIWAVMRADSLEDAQEQVAKYPMHEFLRITYTPIS